MTEPNPYPPLHECRQSGNPLCGCASNLPCCARWDSERSLWAVTVPGGTFRTASVTEAAEIAAEAERQADPFQTDYIDGYEVVR